MAWIESHQDIREHPKTYALMECLKISKRDAIGLVHLLWWWALDNAMTGEIRQPNGAVARAVEWDGDATELVQALIKTGWMERTEGALRIHDWIHRAGSIVEKRLARKVLREKKADAKRRPNGRRTDAERTPNGAENLPTVSVSVSVSESIPKEKTKDKDIAAVNGTAAKPLPPHVEFVEGFTKTYEAMTGNKFKAGDKEFTLAAQLVRKFGFPSCVSKVQILGELCRDKTAWFTKDGWAAFTIPKLSERWNEILPRNPEPTKDDEFREELKKQEVLRARANHRL